MGIKVEQVLHMVGGAGETSYATNSRLQEKTLYRTKPILDNAIEEMYRTLLPERLVVADLGCSSGPNTFLVVSEVLGVVGELRRRLEQKPPEIQFFLNDLPGNDFNNVFRSLERYGKKIEEEKGELLVPYYVVGVPGSFYGRLFPCTSVHFFHSSYCLMWLSQVSFLSLESDRGVPLNKGNIYITETSPPQVVEAYQEQYRRDFSSFLKSRYAELSVGGGMVLTFLGRKKQHPAMGDLSLLWGLLAEALNSMASEGVIVEEKVDSFNLPFYGPSMQEVKSVIHDEGLFDLDQAQMLESNWDPFDDSEDDLVFDNVANGKNVARYIRAVIEPLIAHQFGDAILDELFLRYADNVSKHCLKAKTKFTILVIGLKRKA
ncbi:unnamed protein product [Musa acuminata var. zebrina]